MPLQEDGAPKAYTWITGDPRSKKNITQIRRHAGQNSGLRTDPPPSLRRSPSHQDQQSSTKRFRAVYPFVKADGTAESSKLDLQPSFRPDQTPGSNVDLVERPPSAGGTQRSILPHARPRSSPTPSTSSVTPAKRLAIWDLVNHPIEGEEKERLQSQVPSPRCDVEKNTLDVDDESIVLSDLACTLRETRMHSVRAHVTGSTSQEHAVIHANISKHRKPASGSSHFDRRLISMPLSLRALSADESLVEKVLSQVDAFYTSKFESSWADQLRKCDTAFEIIGEMEHFSGSITTAAGLIAVGQIDSASNILSRVLPTLHQMLLSQHPTLYYVLAELSLDASTTDLGRLRGQVKQFAASASETILGSVHPITTLLQISLSSHDQQVRLRELVQRRIHDLHDQFFTATSFQTTSQYYYLARVLAQLGKSDEAASILSTIIDIWEDKYGINNLMPVTGLLELTKVLLTQDDLSEVTEGLVKEAMARTLAVEALSAQASVTMSTDARDAKAPPLASFHSLVSLSTSILHARMGCLRTLGRLHVMRNDLAIALQHYTQAVSLGISGLGTSCPAVQLAVADLDAASQIAVFPAIE